MRSPPHGGVAAPPVVGSRVWLDGKAATVGRAYGDLVAVVFENEATVTMVPQADCTQAGLNRIGRNIRAVIRRENIAAARSAYLERHHLRVTPQTHCLRRAQARGTARRRVAVRRTCGSRASPSRPRKADDDDLAPSRCPLPGGFAAVPGWSR